MENYNIYLLQYRKGKERVNRFYGTPTRVSFHLSDKIEQFAQAIQGQTLEKIASAVEKDVLEKESFVAIRGVIIHPYYDQFVEVQKIELGR